MKPIAEEIIQDILRQADIVDIISDYVQLKKSGRNYVGLCPFHSEKTPSFSVSAEKQFYHCFGCSASGNALSFLMNIEGYTFPQAVYELGQKVGVTVVQEDQSTFWQQEQGRTNEKEWMFKAHHLAAQLFHHMLLERKEGKDARDYLEARGFQIETIKEFQIGYAPDSWDFLTSFLQKRDYPLSIMEKGGLLSKSEDGKRYFDRFRGRIMFPIWDTQGKVVAFGGRLLNEGTPKYLNSTETPIFRKGRSLFNLHRARPEIRKQKTAILFEGYVDTILAWQAGIRHSLATLGTAFSADQARLIARNADQVIICFDGDGAGLEASIKAAEMLESYGNLAKIATLPANTDPDEYIRRFGAEAFEKKIMLEAKALTAFRLEFLKKGRNLQDDGERMKYIAEALSVISKLPRAVERDHYLRQLANEFSLSLEALKQEQMQILRIEKKKRLGDKDNQKWHNRIKDTKHLVARKLMPRHYQAERILLAHMLRDKQVAEKVQRKVGSQFNVDEHGALAAYLYAFYAEGNQADTSLFLAYLDDAQLSSLVTELSMMTISPMTDEVFEDCTREILNYPKWLEIDKKEEERRLAEREGNNVLAAHILHEITEMKKRILQGN